MSKSEVTQEMWNEAASLKLQLLSLKQRLCMNHSEQVAKLDEISQAEIKKWQEPMISCHVANSYVFFHNLLERLRSKVYVLEHYLDLYLKEKQALV